MVSAWRMSSSCGTGRDLPKWHPILVRVWPQHHQGSGGLDAGQLHYLAIPRVATNGVCFAMAIEPDYTSQGGVWSAALGCWQWHDEQGQLHRVAGPAVIGPDDCQEWYLHGQLHRVAGPALIRADGTQWWYLHGSRHRAAGPALIYPNGRCEWYQHGFPHRVDGPAVTHPDGGQWWYLHGSRHRADGPAVIYPNGRCEWWLHGKFHRVAGPAVIYPNGRPGWFVYGRNITDEVEDWMQANSITWPFNESQQMEFALRWV